MDVLDEWHWWLNERMTEKAWDGVYVTSLLWKVLLPFINAAYTRIIYVHILRISIILAI
jgi:hypothetical protein